MTSESSEAPSGRQRRRRYDPAFKRTIVEQTLAPGASVARIAREHDINANQLFKWRRQFLLEGMTLDARPGLHVLTPLELVDGQVVAGIARVELRRGPGRPGDLGHGAEHVGEQAGLVGLAVWEFALAIFLAVPIRAGVYAVLGTSVPRP